MGNTTHRYFIDAKEKHRDNLPALLGFTPKTVYTGTDGLVIIAHLTDTEVAHLLKQPWVRSISSDENLKLTRPKSTV